MIRWALGSVATLVKQSSLFRNAVYQLYLARKEGSDSVKDLLRGEEQSFMKLNATKTQHFLLLY